jgi:hypothetical protein
VRQQTPVGFPGLVICTQAALIARGVGAASEIANGVAANEPNSLIPRVTFGKGFDPFRTSQSRQFPRWLGLYGCLAEPIVAQWRSEPRRDPTEPIPRRQPVYARTDGMAPEEIGSG